MGCAIAVTGVCPDLIDEIMRLRYIKRKDIAASFDPASAAKKVSTPVVNNKIETKKLPATPPNASQRDF